MTLEDISRIKDIVEICNYERSERRKLLVNGERYCSTKDLMLVCSEIIDILDRMDCTSRRDECFEKYHLEFKNMSKANHKINIDMVEALDMLGRFKSYAESY